MKLQRKSNPPISFFWELLLYYIANWFLHRNKEKWSINVCLKAIRTVPIRMLSVPQEHWPGCSPACCLEKSAWPAVPPCPCSTPAAVSYRSAGERVHPRTPTHPEDLHFHLWVVCLTEHTALTLTWREDYRCVSERLIQSEVVLKWKHEGTIEDIKNPPNCQNPKQLFRTAWELTFLSMSKYHVYSSLNSHSIYSNLLKVLQKLWSADSKAFKCSFRDTRTLKASFKP